jgi:hypothetical protein
MRANRFGAHTDCEEGGGNKREARKDSHDLQRNVGCL